MYFAAGHSGSLGPYLQCWVILLVEVVPHIQAAVHLNGVENARPAMHHMVLCEAQLSYPHCRYSATLIHMQTPEKWDSVTRKVCALGRKSCAFSRGPCAVVGKPMYLVRDPVHLVGDPVHLVRDLVHVVGDPVRLVTAIK